MRNKYRDCGLVARVGLHMLLQVEVSPGGFVVDFEGGACLLLVTNPETILSRLVLGGFGTLFQRKILLQFKCLQSKCVENLGRILPHKTVQQRGG